MISCVVITNNNIYVIKTVNNDLRTYVLYMYHIIIYMIIIYYYNIMRPIDVIYDDDEM